MKKILLTIIFLILFIIFPQQVSANKPKVAIIGSSSFHAGCNQNNGFVNQLIKAYPDKNFECFTKRGTNTKYFKKQFDTNVKGQGFSELIIYAGLNGLANKLKPSQKNLIEIFRNAEQENITVIVISAQPFGKYQNWNQTWGDNLIKNHEWLKGKPEGIDYFVDIYSIIKDSANEYRMNPIYASSDGLHMNKKGQDLMFEKISEIYKTGSITNLNNTSNNTTTPVSLTANEKDRMVAQPTLQIRIPGLNFTEGIELFKKDDGNVYLYSKFFQQYIVAVYKYSVIAISILAVFMIIVAGIQWMISGGSPDKIKAAQKRIGQSIIGLLIAVGSYTILYTINPYLVGFKALETLYLSESISYISADNYLALTSKTIMPKNEIEKIALNISKDLGLKNDCIVKVLLQIESGSNPAAIGHDENIHRNITARRNFLKRGKTFKGKTFTPITKIDITSQEQKNIKNDDNDTKNGICTDKNTLCLDWDFSHGIGLTQVTIFYPTDQCSDGFPGKKDLIDPKKCYSLVDLLDPEINLRWGINLFIKNMNTAEKLGYTGNDIIFAAYKAYNKGAGSLKDKNGNRIDLRNDSYANKSKKLFEQCMSK